MPVYYSTIPLILNVGLRADQPLATDVGTGTLYSVSDEAFLIEQSDGATWGQWGPTPNGGTGSAGILKATTVLTNAEIKALPTTPITLVSAPGAGFRVKVFGLSLAVNTGSGAYTNVNTTYADWHADPGYIAYGPVNDSTTSPALTVLTQWLTTAHDAIYDLMAPTQVSRDGYVLSVSINAAASWDNIALTLAADNNGSGNYTGGHAANSLTVTTYYAIEAVP